MAFFKLRRSGDESSVTQAQPESVDMMRRRAKYRLIGATVLVLIGVVGFPLLFDKQARPIAVDTPIDIPDKNKVKPLALPAPPAAEAVKPVEAPKPDIAASAAPAQPASATPTPTAPKVAEKPLPPPVALVPPTPAVVEKPVVKPVVKPAEKTAEKPVAKVDESAKVKALLDGKTADKKTPAAEGRFVVQIGAFSDAGKAREARLKAEHAGLKTYTQVVETKDGRRIRVRVGPFGDKAGADKAADKIKKLALPAAVLTL